MTIQIKFDGDLVVDNKISLRTMAQTYSGLQKAFERAYLDIDRGGLAKNETIHTRDYIATEFYFVEHTPGSFRAIFEGINNFLSKQIIDRVGRAIDSPYRAAISDAEIEYENLLKQAESFRDRESQPIKYAEAISDSRIYVPRPYGDKSIVSSFSNSLIPAKRNKGSGSSIEYTLQGNSDYNFYFDSIIANRFTRLARGKILASPIEYECHVMKLDGKNLKATVRHTVNGKEATLIFADGIDYNKVVLFAKRDGKGNPVAVMRFVGYAVREMGVIDLECGDIVFNYLLEQ